LNECLVDDGIQTPIHPPQTNGMTKGWKKMYKKRYCNIEPKERQTRQLDSRNFEVINKVEIERMMGPNRGMEKKPELARGQTWYSWLLLDEWSSSMCSELDSKLLHGLSYERDGR